MRANVTDVISRLAKKGIPFIELPLLSTQAEMGILSERREGEQRGQREGQERPKKRQGKEAREAEVSELQ